jgi:hypothetical protein
VTIAQTWHTVTLSAQKIFNFEKCHLKKMDTVPTGNPVFHTAKINNPQTKKPYLIKGQHFRVFEKNSGFRVQVLN